MREIRVPFGDNGLSGSVHRGGETVLLLGQGAGGTRKTPILVNLAEAVAGSQGGDHSFAVPQRAGSSQAQVESEIVGVIAAWLDAHRP